MNGPVFLIKQFLRKTAYRIRSFFGLKIIVRGKRNKVHRNYTSAFKDCCVRVCGKGNTIVFGSNGSFSGLHILAEGDNNTIIFGDNVFINGSKRQPVVCNAASGSTIRIGDQTAISNNVEIHSTDYHKIFEGGGSIQSNLPASIVVGEHCWICLGSLLLKGSRLAPGSIVGAKAVVTKAFDEMNVIVAGNPAKVIKRNIRWDL